MVTKLIRTEEEYQAAMNRIDEIFHSPAGTPEGDVLDRLVGLVESYEAERFPIAEADAGFGDKLGGE